jgi:tripartite-type tricarboxylate transporter receptor subunit TctC
MCQTGGGLALAPLAASLSALGQGSGLPKTIILLVPQKAGGSNDVMARAVAARLPPLIGSNAVVENRPGAGGNIGSAWVAKSAPKDGSVWLVTVNSAQAVNPTCTSRRASIPSTISSRWQASPSCSTRSW